MRYPLLLLCVILTGCSTNSLHTRLELTTEKRADNERIAELASGAMTLQHVLIESVDGLKYPAYLFTPLDTTGMSALRPTVIYQHGGEHGTFSARVMRHVPRFIDRGWNVLALDYRSSSGYGQAFLDLADYGGLEIDDALAARDWLVEQGHAPAGKIATLGGSHGGYNSLMAVARRPNDFAACVDFYGPTDLVYRVTSSPEENSNAAPGDPAKFARMVGATVQENEQAYRDRSPRFLAERITTPVLIIHGTADGLVNIRESQWLVEAFKAAGKENFEYMVIEDARHGFPAELYEPAWDRAVEFLAEHLDE